MILPARTQIQMSVPETKRWNLLKFKTKNAREDVAKVRSEYYEMARWNDKDRRLSQISDRVTKYDKMASDADKKELDYFNYLLLKYS